MILKFNIYGKLLKLMVWTIPEAVSVKNICQCAFRVYKTETHTEHTPVNNHGNVNKQDTTNRRVALGQL